MIIRIMTCCFLILCSSCSNLSTNFIEIDPSSGFFKESFQFSDTYASPSIETGWSPLPKNELVIFPNLERGKLSRRTFLSLGAGPTKEYTFSYSFILPIGSSPLFSPFAILLPSIGGSWEIYLNGQLVQSELAEHPGKNRFTYNILLPLPSQLFNSKENWITFRIKGDAANPTSGFYLKKNFLIGPYNSLASEQDESPEMFANTIYYIIGIFCFFFYLRIPQNAYLLTLVFICFFVSTFLLGTINKGFYILEDSDVTIRIVYSCIYFGVVSFSVFTNQFLRRKQNFIDLLIVGLFGFFGVVLWLGSVPFLYDLFSFSKFLGLSVVFYIFFYHLLKSIRGLYKYKGLKFTVFNSQVGSLFLGLSTFFASIIIDILDDIYFRTGFYFTRYSFVVFIIGVTFTYLGKTISMNKKNSELKRTLQNSLRASQKLNSSLQISESRYKFLLDTSKDLIFILDEEFRFKSLNDSGRKFLGISPKEISGKSFFDILYTKDDPLAPELIRLKISEAKDTKGNIHFKVNIKQPRLGEPIEIDFTFESIDTSGKREYLGKGIKKSEDKISRFVKEERELLIIDNFISQADDVCFRLVRTVESFLPPEQVNSIRLGVREIVMNAIEHGNLEITTEEKNQAIEQGKYLELIYQRQSDPKYMSRKVIINYTLTQNMLEYVIQDEGSGFNFKELLKQDLENVPNSQEFGRGIFLTRQIFDVFQYEGKGNKVRLIKNLHLDS